MKTSIVCPKCTGQITLWQALRAPTPFRIRCARCRTKLRVRFPGLVGAFVGLSFVAALFGGYAGYLVATRHWAQAVILLLTLLIGLLVLEVLTGLLLFTYAEFTPIDQKANEKQNA
jgi:hypothetical protein